MKTQLVLDGIQFTKVNGNWMNQSGAIPVNIPTLPVDFIYRHTIYDIGEYCFPDAGWSISGMNRAGDTLTIGGAHPVMLWLWNGEPLGAQLESLYNIFSDDLVLLRLPGWQDEHSIDGMYIYEPVAIMAVMDMYYCGYAVNRLRAPLYKARMRNSRFSEWLIIEELKVKVST